MLLHVIMATIPINLADNRFTNIKWGFSTFNKMMCFGTFPLHIYHRFVIDPPVVTWLVDKVALYSLKAIFDDSNEYRSLPDHRPLGIKSCRVEPHCIHSNIQPCYRHFFA